ncbi:MAG: hypothetical protein ACTSO2_09500 [Promethearchaeota archaeon]
MKDLYIASYPFLDKFKLSAIVNRKDGTQVLRISFVDKYDNELDFKEIKCIHVALVDTTLNEIENKGGKEEYNRQILYMHSSEGVKEINLSPTEKFKAFQSWVAGIAEAGYNAFYIQREIEDLGHLTYPISKFLMDFIVKKDKRILEEYLLYLERACRYDAQWHESSVIANLQMLKDIENIIPYLVNIRFPFKALMKVFGEEFIAHPAATEYEEYKELFNAKDWRIRRTLTKNPQAKRFKEYNKLFPRNFIRNRTKREIAEDIKATDYEEYRRFFEEEPLIKRIVASNPAAIKFEEFKKLFEDESWIVRSATASNPSAVQFEEYKRLFDDENWIVRSSVASNSMATKFNEYRKLFKDKNKVVLKSIASNPEATKFEEFKNLFYENDDEIKAILASNPEATKFKEFKNLFHEKRWSILVNISLNPKAKKFKEYEMFSKRELLEITTIEEFARHPKATQYEEYKILFKFGDTIIKRLVANNIAAVKFDEYKLLFKDESAEVRQAVASNPVQIIIQR